MKTIIEDARRPKAMLILAHGAGAGKDSDFMRDVANQFVEQQISVLRFDFPYMQKAQALNRRRPPDRMPVLQQFYTDVLANQQTKLPLFIGGKSMGGRVASLVAESEKVRGVVCFGYPFHPPGKLDKLRTEHLYRLAKPMFIAQGERDTFGTQAQIVEYGLPDHITLHFLASGDHSLKPLKSSGLNQQQHIRTAVKAATQFIEEHI